MVQILRAHMKRIIICHSPQTPLSVLKPESGNFAFINAKKITNQFLNFCLDAEIGEFFQALRSSSYYGRCLKQGYQ